MAVLVFEYGGKARHIYFTYLVPVTADNVTLDPVKFDGRLEVCGGAAGTHFLRALQPRPIVIRDRWRLRRIGPWLTLAFLVGFAAHRNFAYWFGG